MGTKLLDLGEMVDLGEMLALGELLSMVLLIVFWTDMETLSHFGEMSLMMCQPFMQRGLGGSMQAKQVFQNFQKVFQRLHQPGRALIIRSDVVCYNANRLLGRS